MGLHITFTGEIGERMDRISNRWMRLAKKAHHFGYMSPRAEQLMRRLDKAFEIAEFMATTPRLKVPAAVF